MEKLLEKISSYNIFNYLIPGIIFVIFIQKLYDLKILHNNLILDLAMVYFIGLIISRIGSIFIEPLMKHKKLSSIKFTKYEEYIDASERDNKIELLSEQNNMFRTFISLFVILFCSEIYIGITSYFSLSLKTNINILIGILIILFVLSYRKQTNYITQRVEIYKNKQNKEDGKDE